MALTIDARGLACPQPVVLTNNAFDKSDEVITIVDNEASRENVSRLAKSKGFQVDVEEKGSEFHLHLTREGPAVRPTSDATSSEPIVLLIASDAIGRGSEELGRNLMTSFIQVLPEITPQPSTIIFTNSGVKLVVEGSEVIEALRTLEKQGTELLACGACLAYYEITEKIAVRQISNVYEVASKLFNAGKIINP